VNRLKGKIGLFFALMLVTFTIAVGLKFNVIRQPIALNPPARPIPATLFGLHIHHLVKKPSDLPQVTPWPSVEFGTWRLWDAHIGWLNLEKEKGQWQFDTLDRYLEIAREREVELLLPLGLSPKWASARPEEPSAYAPGAAAEPKNIEDWQNYVRTVGTRYRGRLPYYEIWNEPNWKRFFTGSTEQMFELAREAHEILKPLDPEIAIVSPSATDGKHGAAWLADYFALGGVDYSDIIGFHFYVGPGEGPEDAIPVIQEVQQVMSDYGVADKPLWNTEAGWLGDQPFEDPQTSVAYVARAYILNWASGVERLYWYDWDFNPIVRLHLVKEDNKTLTPAGVAYGEIYDWLVGARMDECHSDLRYTWTCQLTRDRDYQAWILWNPDRSSSFSVPEEWKVAQVRYLNGERRRFQGSKVEIGPTPILLERTGDTLGDSRANAQSRFKSS